MVMSNPYSAIRKVLSPSWLTGPIFGKELRVSSRRRRNYVLRFVYLMLLTGFLASMIGEAGKIRLEASVAVRNEPFGGTTTGC